ncbi:MAG: outer membrane protein assembly factor BamC [Marinobacter sp.]|uniref:outer membrane protein assembly factor BamC n=1 Tax=Marinobacter sp. TaxID=50741 RepID=UPI0034A040F4
MAVQSRKVLTGSVFGFLLSAGLAGCSLIDDRSENYVNASEGEPLKLAEGHVMERRGEAFPIREIGSNNRGEMNPSDIPQPPDMTSEILEENYIIEEVDDQAWVLVNDVPGRVWPSVTAYFNDRGLGVVEDSTQLGVIQSDVVNFSQRARTLLQLPQNSEGEELVVVQARVTPGVRRKTTEIQLRKLEISESPDQLLQWQSDSDNLIIEKSLLTDLASYLEARDDTKSYSRAALTMTTAPKVAMVNEDGIANAIEMVVGFDRAWAEVRRALDEAEVPVVDLDRSNGIFYVDFRTDEERDPGWFNWFADEPTPEYTFQVRLETQQDRVLVSTAKSDEYAGNDRSQRLLSELFEYLY